MTFAAVVVAHAEDGRVFVWHDNEVKAGTMLLGAEYAAEVSLGDFLDDLEGEDDRGVTLISLELRVVHNDTTGVRR